VLLLIYKGKFCILNVEGIKVSKLVKGKTILSREEEIAALKEERPYLKDRYSVERIILFNSFAKRNQKKKSDVDILVDLSKPLGLEFVELSDRLEEKLGRKFDFATFEHFKKSFYNSRYKHIDEDIKKSMIYV
jgi:hypothetical protein